MSSRNRKTLYVSGYWHIPKRQMPHMGIARYIRLAPETFKMISEKQLVFYYEEDFIGELVKRVCENFGVSLHLIRRSVGELPARPEAVRIARAASSQGLRGKTGGKEKGRNRLSNMVFGDNRNEYEDNLSVWLSKIALLEEVFEQKVVPCQNIAWIDVGISKFNFLRPNWDFTAFSARADKRMLHFGSDMAYLGERLPLNASFLQAPGDLWPDLNGLFSAALDDAIGDEYPHDEETILGGIVRQYPGLFECIGKPYKGWSRLPRYTYERIRYGRVRRF